MKNDYKIGLVIGLLVLLLGVGYFIFRGPAKAKTTETPMTTIDTPASDSSFTGETTATDSTAGSGFTPPPPPSTPDTAAPAETATVAPAVPPVAPAAPAAETVEPATVKPADATLAERVGNWSDKSGKENAVAPAAADTVAPRLTTNDTVAVKPVAGNTPAADSTGGEWGVPPVAPAANTGNAASTVDTAATTPDTYVVQPNDVGWYVAENVYGKGMGRFWTLIRDANPNVDMSNLKKGQTLKIPPLPETAKERMRDNASQGNSFTDASGQRIYVTKSGDSMWTIAQNVYGKGHLYKEIQKANPKVDTNYLRPGLRLVIPEVAGAATTPAAGGDESTATFGSDTVTAVSSSQKYYVVKSGDSLWTIAEAEYGDGNLANLITKANPNINPNNIRVGQRLVIPAKPEGGEPAATNGNGSSADENDPNADNGTTERRRPSRSSSSDSVPSDEPDFGL